MKNKCEADPFNYFNQDGATVMIGVPLKKGGYIVLGLFSLLMVACSASKFSEAEFEKQRLILSPYSPETKSRIGDGFVVTIRSQDAYDLKAPFGPEFIKALEDQLATEKRRGVAYCPSGYEIKEIIHFKHYDSMVLVNCKKLQ